MWQMFSDLFLDSPLVGAHHFVNLLSVFEEEESGHGTDAQFLGEIRNLVDIDLVEFGAVLEFVTFGEFGYLGSNHLAGTAPNCEAVKHHEVAILDVGDFLVEC